MKITLDNPQSEYVFSNYGEGFLCVNEQTLNSSVLIFPDFLEPWAVTEIGQLTVDHLQVFIARKPDILLLGTGIQQQFPGVDLRRKLVMQNVQLDVMDTPAACRTYNLLVSEDRDVGAAIMLI